MSFLPGAESCISISHVTHGCDLCKVEKLETLVVPDALQKLFSTNDPPNNQILPSLLASLDTVRSVSVDIDECIVSMESILSRVRRAKETCTFSIKQHEAVFHPIRSIPDDILLEIFQWYAWPKKTGEDGVPWTLSHVSRRWHALALSSLSLWSTIAIQHRKLKSDHNIRSLASRWKVVIQRSMDSDLFVDLVYNVNRADDVVHLLLPTTRRWKTLKLSTWTPFTASLRHSSFARLTKLKVFGNPQYTDTVSMFTRAPNLRSLTLKEYVNIDVLWNRITTYSYTFEGLRYLHKLTALEHLTLTLISAPQHVSSIFPSEVSIPLSLSTLRSLSIIPSTYPSFSVAHISTLLYLPSLTTFATAYTSTLPLFTGPVPHLQEICIRSSLFPGLLFPFFSAYDTITSLHVRSLDVLRGLLIIADQPVLLPHLTILGVDPSMLVGHPNDVLEALESRCHNEGGRVAQLAEFRISERILTPSSLLHARDIYTGARWENVRSKVKLVVVRCPHCL